MVKSAFLAATLFVAASPAWAAPDGAALYAAKCAMCHQADGRGVRAQYPPLAGRVAHIAASAQGRAYLGHVLVNGMAGMLRIDGANYVGYMPTFQSLTDADIAAVLTYVASLGAPKPAAAPGDAITPDTIHAARTPPISPTAVNTERMGLRASGIVP